MTSTLTRAERNLNKISKQDGLTEDGKAWLIAAIDPFHDDDYRLAGYPDMHSEGTLVQLVKKQFTISRPSNVPVGNSYDANIVLYPTATAQKSKILNNMTFSKIVTGDDVGGDTYYGGIVATTCPSGQRTFTSGSGGGADSAKSSFVSIPDVNIRGDYRVIGAAFEVTNTSSVNDRGGQCTVFRAPAQPARQLVYYQSPDNNPLEVRKYNSALILRSPPGSIDETQALMGTRSWAASEGAYVVARQNSLVNPMNSGSYDVVALRTGDYTNADQTYTLITNDTIDRPPVYRDKICPFDISGAYFTGLPSDATLTINVRWLIERVPSFSSELASMVSPAARYDPVALLMYAAAMVQAPPGVMLSENPLGEWFAKAVDWIGRWAPTVGGAASAAGVPFAGTIGSVIGATANAVSKAVNYGTKSDLAPSEPEPKKKSKQKSRKRKSASAKLTVKR